LDFSTERQRNGRVPGDELKRPACAADERGSFAQAGDPTDGERINMDTGRPFLNFLLAFFRFLLALLGRGAPPAA
jgi:hypothetical protein